jgi:hypothetical protein
VTEPSSRRTDVSALGAFNKRFEKGNPPYPMRASSQAENPWVFASTSGLGASRKSRVLPESGSDL